MRPLKSKIEIYFSEIGSHYFENKTRNFYICIPAIFSTLPALISSNANHEPSLTH